jgi:two-component system, LytTR family, response regulator
MTALIVDDEMHFAETLMLFLRRYCPDVEVLHIYNQPEKALFYLKENLPDILFLDVEMPELDGLHLIEALGTPPQLNVIFTTAYDRYAVKAFKVNAVDFLMKPIDPVDLIKAVDKVRQKLIKEGNLTTTKQHSKTHSSETITPSVFLEKISAPTSDGLVFIRTANLVRCEADGSYTYIYMEDGTKHHISKKLIEFEKSLDSDTRFYRVHKSHIINLTKVERYIRGEGGELVMCDGKHVPVSREHKKQLLERL